MLPVEGLWDIHYLDQLLALEAWRRAPILIHAISKPPRA